MAEMLTEKYLATRCRLFHSCGLTHGTCCFTGRTACWNTAGRTVCWYTAPRNNTQYVCLSNQL